MIHCRAIRAPEQPLLRLPPVGVGMPVMTSCAENRYWPSGTSSPLAMGLAAPVPATANTAPAPGATPPLKTAVTVRRRTMSSSHEDQAIAPHHRHASLLRPP